MHTCPGEATSAKFFRRQRNFAIAVVGTLALGLTLPAAGDTPSRTESTRSVPGQPFSGPDLTDFGLPVEHLAPVVSKAKVTFSLPPFLVRGGLSTCFGATVFAGPEVPASCRKLFGLPLPAKYQNPDHNFVADSLNAYVVSSPGPNPTYGSLPPVKVRALAFGTIPVSATVVLTQSSTHGIINPITAQFVVLNSTDSGTPSYPGFPVTPPPSIVDGVSRNNDLAVKLNVHATFTVQVRDLAIDGRSVAVGQNCTTRQAARLDVTPPLGFTDYSSGLPKRGQRGYFQPANTVPGYFDGNVSIPAFANCGTARQDISALLTELVSSPVNNISGYLPVSPINSEWCTLPIAHTSCTAGQRRMQALASAIAAGKSPAELHKLQAKIKPSDYVMPKVKAPKNYGK